MEIVIRVDVLLLMLRRGIRRGKMLLERLYALAVTGAGIASMVYLVYCIYAWLAVA